MGFLYVPLPLWVTFSGWVVAAGTLALAAWRKPFHRLHSGTMQHLWLGTIATISVLWTFDAWLQDGPVLHLLGATLMVTLFGWEIALFGMAAIIGLIALVLDTPWQGVGLTILVLGAVPVATTALLQRLIALWLPRQLAVFIVGHGFFTAAAAVLAAGLAATGLHMSLHHDGWGAVPPGYIGTLLLLAAGEAWFTGMLTTILAVYKPAWVTTYNPGMHRLDR